jgi:hypothetical protein
MDEAIGHNLSYLQQIQLFNRSDMGGIHVSITIPIPTRIQHLNLT